MFNVLWDKDLPHLWKKVAIIPLLKKSKSPDSIKIYRPITLTSVCCKLAERMDVNKLKNYCEQAF